MFIKFQTSSLILHEPIFLQLLFQLWSSPLFSLYHFLFNVNFPQLELTAQPMTTHKSIRSANNTNIQPATKLIHIATHRRGSVMYSFRQHHGACHNSLTDRRSIPINNRTNANLPSRSMVRPKVESCASIGKIQRSITREVQRENPCGLYFSR